MRGDLSVVGFQQSLPRRIAASTTRFYAGEPAHSVATSSSGAASGNVFVPAAADTPVVGTHRFGGIFIKNALPEVTGTLVLQTAMTANPVVSIGRIRGKAETAANVDTQTELDLILGDYTLIDYNATGGVGSSPLYTVKDLASADTSGLEIVDGNTAKSTLDVTLVAVAYRHDYA
jgi:hypothetical protein